MKKKHIFSLIGLLFLLVIVILLIVKFGSKVTLEETPKTAYIASTGEEVVLYDEEYNESLKL